MILPWWEDLWWIQGRGLGSQKDLDWGSILHVCGGGGGRGQQPCLRSGTHSIIGRVLFGANPCQRTLFMWCCTHIAGLDVT